MSENKEKKVAITDVTTISKDGVLEVPDIAKPTNPPGLRPVNSNPLPQDHQAQSSVVGGEITSGEDK